jgi:hypothetical protein
MKKLEIIDQWVNTDENGLSYLNIQYMDELGSKRVAREALTPEEAKKWIEENEL